jgi:TPR repeat protein
VLLLGCASVGEVARPAPETADSYGVAFTTLAACDRGDSAACAQACDAYLVPVEHAEKGLPSCRRACDLGELVPCRQILGLVSHGYARAADGERAMAQLDEACTAGRARGCTLLGPFTPPARAILLYGRGCDGGDAAACVESGRFYKQRRDLPRAVQVLTRACELDAAACDPLGRMYLQGEGVAADFGRAFQLFTQACDAGDGRACSRLSYLYKAGSGVPRDPARAAQLEKRACQKGHLATCNRLCNGCIGFVDDWDW